MASHGIRDRVAIVGMGCTHFGEHWDKGADDLLDRRGHRGVRLGRHHQGRRRRLLARHDGLRASSGLTLSPPAAASTTSRSPGSRTCAPPARRRSATPATRSRPAPIDMAMAIGVEKLKDSRLLRPRPARRRPTTAPRAELTAPAMFSLLAPGLRQEVRRRRRRDEGRPHAHRVEEPQQRRAQPAGAVPQGGAQGRHLRCSPLMAGQLGIFDCSGVSDGSAAAVIVRAEDAHRYTDKPIYVKGLSFVAGPGAGPIDPDYDYTTFPEVVALGRGRLPAGRRHRPARRAGAWPRCTTASRPPSSSSWRTSASPSGASAGRRCWPAPSTSTASSRSTPTAGSRRSATPSAPVGPADAVRVLAAAPRRGAGRAHDPDDRRGQEARPSPTTSAARPASASRSSPWSAASRASSSPSTCLASLHPTIGGAGTPKRSGHVVGFAFLMTLNIAPCGSVSAAMRPTSGTSIGPLRTLAPPFLAVSTVERRSPRP